MTRGIKNSAVKCGRCGHSSTSHYYKNPGRGKCLTCGNCSEYVSAGKNYLHCSHRRCTYKTLTEAAMVKHYKSQHPWD